MMEMSGKKHVWREIADYIGILAGAAISALSFVWFIIPNALAPGGVSGIAHDFARIAFRPRRRHDFCYQYSAVYDFVEGSGLAVRREVLGGNGCAFRADRFV